MSQVRVAAPATVLVLGAVGVRPMRSTDGAVDIVFAGNFAAICQDAVNPADIDIDTEIDRQVAHCGVWVGAPECHGCDVLDAINC